MEKDFKSRFMPNVKFTAIPSDSWAKIAMSFDLHPSDYYYVFNDMIFDSGSYVKVPDCDYSVFEFFKEVIIYEAIPELVPKGFSYCKENGTLKPNIDLDKEKLAKKVNLDNGFELNPRVKFMQEEKFISDEYTSGIDFKNHRAYNVGSSNYSAMNIQPWDIWKDWKLDPWDADIVKRISRTKKIPGKTFEEARIEDYEKIKHICDEKISQLQEKLSVK